MRPDGQRDAEGHGRHSDLRFSTNGRAGPLVRAYSKKAGKKGVIESRGCVWRASTIGLTAPLVSPTEKIAPTHFGGSAGSPDGTARSCTASRSLCA